ncbi:hypothetical protein ACFYRN_45160 [Streptomyces sp. NPDC005227]|uniref:hypothetical protein n=1 Tax=Streptomyces sp. NPDC005227 TaxID=3364707 RepID=UPI003698802E
MTEPIAPNPHSPYADADPEARHLLPSPIFFPEARPGVLAVAACLRMAVVPEEPLRDVNGLPDGVFPPGMCNACIEAFYAESRGERYRDDRPPTVCSECGSRTRHDGLCALCRQEKHDAWWPTRGEQPGGDPLAYGPTGIPCGCGKDAHSNLVPCQPDPAGEQPAVDARPYTDADLRAEAVRQLSAHGPGITPEQSYSAMLDAHIASTRDEDSGPTWSEALSAPELAAPADAVHALIKGAADVADWGVRLGADELTPSNEHVITINAGVRPFARLHFAFAPGMDEEMRTALVKGVGGTIDDALAEVDEEDVDEPGDSDSDVFDLISTIAGRLQDATDSGEYHAVCLIADLANGRTTVAEARTELADIEFGHV